VKPRDRLWRLHI